MNVGGVAINYPIGYEARKTQRTTAEMSFASTMGKTTGTKSTGLVLHISNEEDGIAIGSSADHNGSVTVFKPNDFDPENPIYKVKVWDAAGNVTEERMVDISKVDPNNSDYLDMFAYTSHLTNSGECTGAQAAFMSACSNPHGAGSVYDSYLEKMDWKGIVEYAITIQARKYGKLYGIQEVLGLLGAVM